jgi:ferrous iron transport protein B
MLNFKSAELLLVGNPNAGKSTLFNQLTGLKQEIGNFSGITVEKSLGQLQSKKYPLQIVDLPGIYSLVPQQQTSQDERVALNYLLDVENAIVINVVDATCLERHLYLTIQLRELGIPMVLVLNKWDLAQKQNISIDIQKLTKLLGCPVITSNANQTNSVLTLENILSQLEPPTLKTDEVLSEGDNRVFTRTLKVNFNKNIEDKLQHVDQGKERFQAILALIDQQFQQPNSSEDVELEVASKRYQLCNNIVQQCIANNSDNEDKLTEKLDNWLLKPWVAIPTFLLAMYLMFMFAINVGGAFIDFFDIAAKALFVDGLAQLLNGWNFPQWLVVILTEGAGTGVETVATFIPLIFCLYLFLTALEQSGYLARAAVVTDRIMQKMGLPGSAFVPLMMGFGCTVPAVMATRTLKQKRERILSSAMSHFMVCGARLPVFALFGAAFFLDNALHIVFLLYLLGIVAALFTGVVFRKTVLAGEASPFIIELPQYQLPYFKDLFNRTWQRLKGFMFGAGKIIVIVVTILGVINSLGRDGSFGNAGTENSLLSTVGQVITPVFEPVGIEEDNWQATVGIFTGLFAKEVLVATLNSLYQEPVKAEKFVLSEQLQAAVSSIGTNLADLGDKLFDPLGLSSADVSSVEEAANSQDVSMTTMERIASHFDGKAGAFSYMLFILLYAPCASALGAIAREFTGRWALFIALWATALAYTVATVFYQLSTLEGVFSSQSLTLLLVLLFNALIYVALRSNYLKTWLTGGQSYVGSNSKAACH